jgi:hypothetical protein
MHILKRTEVMIDFFKEVEDFSGSLRECVGSISTEKMKRIRLAA